MYSVTMGDRGRLVVPAELRSRAGLGPGQPVVLVESDQGIVLLTREQLKARVRGDLTGLDLVGDLLAERARSTADEDLA
jgi:AbrB family looped-hinge helix DNA binding protein